MTFIPPNSHRSGLPIGLAGAVAPTRYVGGTTTGAPASGTFAVGDFVIAQDGSVFVCTVAGTPGTWVQIGASTDLAYGEATANVACTATSGATANTIATASAFTADGSQKVLVEFICGLWTHSGTANQYTVLYEGSTLLCTINQQLVGAGNAGCGACYGAARFTPAAGARTYSARGFTDAGTSTYQCGDGGPGNRSPAIIRVTRA